MNTKQFKTSQWIVFILALSLMVIACSKDSSSPVDSATNASNTPASPSPAHGATLQPTSLELKWSCGTSGSQAITYDVYFGTTNPPTSTIVTNTSQTTMARTALSNLTMYYWQIDARSSNGTSTKGPVWQFTTGVTGMVLVQGGKFQMGSTALGYIPVHSVTLSSFFIGQCEVTQKQWRDIVVWKQGTLSTPLSPNPTTLKGDSLPVSNISWDYIQIWLGYLNEKEGLTNSEKKYRLPTESEWEFAARGGNNSKGYQYSGSNAINDVAWFSGNSDGVLHVIGSKAPNELGLYDMSGNAFEWCYDLYSATYPSADQIDPTGPSSGGNRCLRGGCSKINSGSCITVVRDYAPPDTRFLAPGNDVGGFRYARTQ